MESFVKKLQKELDSALDNVKEELPLLRRYDLSLKLIKASTEELKTHILGHEFPSVAAEINYFKHLVPPIYARLFYFTRLYNLERGKPSLGKEEYRETLEKEQRTIGWFYAAYEEICAYYVSGATNRDEELFTHNSPDSWDLDYLDAIIGAHLCPASCRVACMLANEQYGDHLNKELSLVDSPEFILGGPADRYVWKESKSAAVELIKALAECQSIQINDEPAMAARLKRGFEILFEIDLSDFDQLLYASDTRKKEETPFLKKLSAAFLARRQRLRK